MKLEWWCSDKSRRNPDYESSDFVEMKKLEATIKRWERKLHTLQKQQEEDGYTGKNWSAQIGARDKIHELERDLKVLVYRVYG